MHRILKGVEGVEGIKRINGKLMGLGACLGLNVMVGAFAAAGCCAAHEMASSRDVIQGGAFRHVVLRSERSAGAELHVYIEGDGTPFLFSGIAARDPTSGAAVMVRLMRLDPETSLLLGRPCYEGLYADRHCNAHYWTDRRFSREVILSMRLALEREIARSQAQRVVLIGYSGGAALAVILAREVPQAIALVTLAGNLDTDAWARIHGFEPLRNSENPLLAGHLPPSIEAVHLVGSKDRVTPEAFIRGAAATIGGKVIVVDGFTHTCCWPDIWPEPLEAIRALTR